MLSYSKINTCKLYLTFRTSRFVLSYRTHSPKKNKFFYQKSAMPSMDRLGPKEISYNSAIPIENADSQYSEEGKRPYESLCQTKTVERSKLTTRDIRATQNTAKKYQFNGDECEAYSKFLKLISEFDEGNE